MPTRRAFAASRRSDSGLAVFLNDYNRLVTPLPVGMENGPGGSIIIQSLLMNAMRGDTYGFELASSYKITDAWQVRAAYSFLVMDLQPLPGNTAAQQSEGGTPHNELYLHSTFDLGRHWNSILSAAMSIPFPPSESPSTLSATSPGPWRPNQHLELAVVGRNLGNGKFYEFGNDNILGTLATEVVPEVYGQVVWRY